MRCIACQAERNGYDVGFAVVLGMMIADLQHRGRMQWAGTLCDRHAEMVPSELPAERTDSDDQRSCDAG